MNKEKVLITGSSKGLGRALAIEFARKGHPIILHGRNKEKIREIGREINSEDYVIGDLKKISVLEKLATFFINKDASVLINNAGILNVKEPFENMSSQEIEGMVYTNLYSIMNLTHKIYSFFCNKKKGTIINICSLAGIEAYEGGVVYCTTKFGLRGFTNALRLEAEKKGIRVLGIYPGRIKTKPEFNSGFEPEYVAKKIYEAYKNPKIEDLILRE